MVVDKQKRVRRYDEGAIPRAVKMIAEGFTQGAACKENNIPGSTFSDYITRVAKRLNLPREKVPQALVNGAHDGESEACRKPFTKKSPRFKASKCLNSRSSKGSSSKSSKLSRTSKCSSSKGSVKKLTISKSPVKERSISKSPVKKRFVSKSPVTKRSVSKSPVTKRSKTSRGPKSLVKKRSNSKPSKMSKSPKCSSSKSPAKKRSKLSLKGSREAKSKDSQKLAPIFKSEPQTEQPSKSETVEELPCEENVEEEKKPCVASIHNLGNTCYLNSVLQVLRHTPGFVQQLQTLSTEVKVTRKEKDLVSQVIGEEDDQDEIFTWSLVRNLSELYRKMSSAEKKYETGDTKFLALRPYDLMDTIERLNPMFEGNLQHDAHEVLRCILAYIQDAAVEVNKFRSQHRQDSGEITQHVNGEGDHENLNVECSGGDEMKDSVNIFKTPEKKIIKSPSSSPLSPVQFYSKTKNPEIVTLNCLTSPVKNGYVTPTKNSSVKINGPSIVDSSVPKTVATVADVFFCQNGTEGKRNKCLLNGDSTLVSQDTKQELVKVEGTKGDVNGKKIQKSRKRKKSLENDQNGDSKPKGRPRGRPRTKNVDSTSLDVDGRCSKRFKSDDLDIIEEDYKESAQDSETGKSSIKNQPSIMSMLYRKPVVKRLGIRGNIVGGAPQTLDTLMMNGHSNLPDEKGDASIRTGGNHCKSDIDKVSNDHVTPTPALTVTTMVVNTEVEQNSEPISSKQTARKTLGIRRCGIQSPFQTTSNGVNHVNGELNADDDSHCLTNGHVHEDDKVQSAMEELKDLNTNSQDEHHLKTDAVQQGQRAIVKLEEMNKEHEYFPMFQKQMGSMKAIQSDMDVLDMLGKRDNVNDTVEEVFQGTMALRTRCLECENYTERREDYQDVGVPIRKEEPEDGWPEEEEEEEHDPYGWIKSAFHEVERLEGDNKYFCDSCHRLVEAERSLHYTVTPSVLTLHLKRFAAMAGLQGGLTKINDHVVTPQELPCMQEGCKEDCKQPEHRYHLYAMVTHTGISISSGHYIAYVRAPDGLKVPIKPPEAENTDSKGNNSEECTPPTTDAVKTEPDVDMLADPNNNADTNNNIGSDCSVDRNLPVKKETVENAASSVVEFEELCAHQLGMWLECDDDTITVLTAEEFEEILSPSGPGSPYLLFYKRTDLEC